MINKSLILSLFYYYVCILHIHKRWPFSTFADIEILTHTGSLTSMDAVSTFGGGWWYMVVV